MPVPQDVLEARIRQRHEYARHTFSIIVSWFTFFVTVNYVAMGWFAGKTETLTLERGRVLVLLACLFIGQIVLGILAELAVLKALKGVRQKIQIDQVNLLGPGAEDQAKDTGLPIVVYERSIRLMVVALVFILLTWVAFPFVSGLTVTMKV